MGFGLPVSGSWATPATMVRIARRAEALGYSSLWTFQRLLGPRVGDDGTRAGPERSPSPRTPEDPAYLAVQDAILPLAYVAGHTERIRLGTATVCAPFTPPAVLAKALTTLDHLSNGRLTVGVGMGWMRHEHVAAGIPYERRGDRFEEYLRCLQALWTQDPVEFDGEFYRVPRSRNALLPLQRPRPPLLVGGEAPVALRRAGRLADGWIASSGHALGGLEESLGHVRDGARDAGRDPDAVHVLMRVLVDLTDAPIDASRAPFRGSAEQVRDDLAELRSRGVTEVLVDLNLDPRVGSPDVDPDAATELAEHTLRLLAPA